MKAERGIFDIFLIFRFIRIIEILLRHSRFLREIQRGILNLTAKEPHLHYFQSGKRAVLSLLVIRWFYEVAAEPNITQNCLFIDAYIRGFINEFRNIKPQKDRTVCFRCQSEIKYISKSLTKIERYIVHILCINSMQETDFKHFIKGLKDNTDCQIGYC